MEFQNKHFGPDSNPTESEPPDPKGFVDQFKSLYVK